MAKNADSRRKLAIDNLGVASLVSVLFGKALWGKHINERVAIGITSFKWTSLQNDKRRQFIEVITVTDDRFIENYPLTYILMEIYAVLLRLPLRHIIHCLQVLLVLDAMDEAVECGGSASQFFALGHLHLRGIKVFLVIVTTIGALFHCLTIRRQTLVMGSEVVPVSGLDKNMIASTIVAIVKTEGFIAEISDIWFLTHLDEGTLLMC